MTLFGFALVLTAAFCHATWNFFVKRINGGPELVWLISFVSMILYMPLAIYVIVTTRPSFGMWETVFILGSVALHLGYFLLLQTGYRKSDLSLVYPTARATGPVLSSTFAVLFLGEVITAQTALGGMIVVFGVVNLTGGFRGGAKNVSTSLLFGLAVGLLIGSYTVWDAYAVATLMISPILLDYASSVGRTILLAPIALRRAETVKAQWRDHRIGVLVIAVFSALAYMLVLYAMTFTPVIYVAPIREVSVLLSVLMGSILLGEGDLQRRLGWAVVILLGVGLLSTA